MINYKRKRNFIIAVTIIAFYSGIGYVFKIDPLKVFVFNKNSFSVSIIGVVICCLTAYCIDFVIKHFSKKRMNDSTDSI